MKYYPALFNDAMVRAILAGLKTQTRWPMNPQPLEGVEVLLGRYEPTMVGRNGEEYPGPEIFGADDPDGEQGWKSPYGGPGDRLWVRECWGLSMNDHGHECLSYRADQGERRGPQMMRLWDPSLKRWELSETESPSDEPEKWRSARHMPRWASRITLEVLDVRAERIQDISEADAILEGVLRSMEYPFENGELPCPDCGGLGLHGAFGENYGVTEIECETCDTIIKRFRFLWDSIYANQGLGGETDPWVWAYELKLIENKTARCMDG